MCSCTWFVSRCQKYTHKQGKAPVFKYLTVHQTCTKHCGKILPGPWKKLENTVAVQRSTWAGLPAWDVAAGHKGTEELILNTAW